MAIKQTTPTDASRLQADDKVVYLDVRSEAEFERGHAPNALNVPVVFLDAGAPARPNPDFVAVVGRVFRDLTVLSPKDKRVLMDLINRPQTPQPLILSLIRSTVATPEILQLIAERAFWVAGPLIRRALLTNSKTPPAVKASLRGRMGAGEAGGVRPPSG